MMCPLYGVGSPYLTKQTGQMVDETAHRVDSVTSSARHVTPVTAKRPVRDGEANKAHVSTMTKAKFIFLMLSYL